MGGFMVSPLLPAGPKHESKAATWQTEQNSSKSKIQKCGFVLLSYVNSTWRKCEVLGRMLLGKKVQAYKLLEISWKGKSGAFTASLPPSKRGRSPRLDTRGQTHVMS